MACSPQGRELLLGEVKEFSSPKLYCGSTEAAKKKGAVGFGASALALVAP
jgi:hypothetical protein